MRSLLYVASASLIFITTTGIARAEGRTKEDAAVHALIGQVPFEGPGAEIPVRALLGKVPFEGPAADVAVSARALVGTVPFECPAVSVELVAARDEVLSLMAPGPDVDTADSFVVYNQVRVAQDVGRP